ncbi:MULTISPECIES: hypothetical protein [unclassified Polaromonas]|uniref:hypothetical protein n=1 Tax=unclassified Polaromonas TaxID=2638319 RepID=UPI0025E66950|nr:MULTISPECIES: hypothetical protein [unclassified Polaromonas]MDP2447955.1 hypothetical protein [Polaromonas sp.]HQR99818.1 hypothetical protein [Polaromonas sp.]HQS42559.1 hypothetical protein [Polaromonas sp.]HQT08577.1 hypothetical protein [Polaromonas sp.]
MKTSLALKTIATCAITTWAGASFGHDGHLMAGAHWHATDAWGFVALGGLVVLAIWLSNKDK